MMKVKSLAFMLLAALPGMAFAQEARPQVRVSYADLNLSTPAGVKALDRRLARAIESICPNGDGTTEVARKIAAWRCHALQREEVARQRERVLATLAGGEALAYSERR